MKILHCVYTVDPVNGGAYEAARQFSLAHLEQGHEVEMASLDLPDAPYLSSLPFKVHPLGTTRVVPVASSPYRYGYSPKFLSWLKANHHRYDAVIVNGIWQYHSYATWKALRKTDTPYFVYPHGMLDPWFKRTYRLKHFKKWLFWPWTDYRVVRDADATLFTCEDEKVRSYKSFWLYRCRPRIATLGLTRPEGDPDTQRETFLDAYPMLRDRRFLLFLSRIHKKKGCKHLIDAFGESAREDKDLHLVMAGPGVGGVRRGVARAPGTFRERDQLARDLARHAGGGPEMGRLPRGGCLHPPLPHGKFRDRGGGSPRVRPPGSDLP